MLTVSNRTPAANGTAAKATVFGCTVSGPGTDLRIRWNGENLFLARFDGSIVSSGKIIAADFASQHWDGTANGATPTGWSLAFGGSAPVVFKDGLKKGLSWTGQGATTVKAFVLNGLTRGDVEIVLPILFTANVGSAGVVLRHSASGGYAAVLERGSYNYIKLYKYNGTGLLTQLASYSITLSENTLYVLRVKMFGQYLQARMWTASGSEGTSWQVTATDTTFSSGQIGLAVWGNAAFAPRFLPPAVSGFPQNGYCHFWADVSGAGSYSDSAVSVDVGTPLAATRTFAGFTALDGYNSLSPLFADGETLSGVEVGVRFSVGSGASDFVLDLGPIMPQNLEMAVASIKIPNKFVSVKGGWQVFGNSLVPYRASLDITATPPCGFKVAGNALVSVLWRGQTIDSWQVTITEDFTGVNGFFVVDYVPSPVPASWDGREGYCGVLYCPYSFPYLASMTQFFGVVSAIDGFSFVDYLVAHPVKRDLVSSAIAGEPQMATLPSSAVVEAWTLAFWASSMIVQGPIPADYVAAITVSELAEKLAAGSFICGIETQDKQFPASLVVWKPEAKAMLVFKRAEEWELNADD